MSDSFNSGRRGPNVTAFLRNLDTTQAAGAGSGAGAGAGADEQFGIDADLALFTNTQFFDYESGQNTDFQPPPAKEAQSVAEPAAEMASPQADSPSSGAMPDLFSADLFSGLPSFNFSSEFPAMYPAPQAPPFADGLGTIPSGSSAAPPPSVFPQESASYSPTASSPRINKRKASEVVSPEEHSKIAAEEDKRRRNTAASARFRIKKKQREQALEKSAKEMAEKNQALEQRVQQLETECKWLRNLLIEKTGDNSVDFGKLFKVVKEKSTKDDSESLDGESPVLKEIPAVKAEKA